MKNTTEDLENFRLMCLRLQSNLDVSISDVEKALLDLKEEEDI